ncbi:uncharacterized protein LOC126160714 [Schistocerca cancellata]|uniref:uncharacterized protein LOC126160714 n=1 Tax=Schistocerca cancellata TaxID=274614 RepID=UPI0021185963|nr:uncharacterized protein LOC126160714 [Schistocerca cancellata]
MRAHGWGRLAGAAPSRPASLAPTPPPVRTIVAYSQRRLHELARRPPLTCDSDIGAPPPVDRVGDAYSADGWEELLAAGFSDAGWPPEAFGLSAAAQPLAGAGGRSTVTEGRVYDTATSAVAENVIERVERTVELGEVLQGTVYDFSGFPTKDSGNQSTADADFEVRQQLPRRDSLDDRGGLADYGGSLPPDVRTAVWPVARQWGSVPGGGAWLLSRLFCRLRLTGDSATVLLEAQPTALWPAQWGDGDPDSQPYLLSCSLPANLTVDQVESVSVTADHPCAPPSQELPLEPPLVPEDRPGANRRDFAVCLKALHFPGDVIAIERPYASVLLDDAYYTHCYNCLLRCNALIPCETCSMVMFCSDECQNEALEKSHSVDCSILAPLTRYGIDKMGMLAVRIILTAAAYGKKLNELISEIQSFEMETSADKRTKGFSKDGKYHSDEYTTIYHLVGNTDKRTVGDLFKRAVNAACILHCFEEYSHFFNPENASSYKQLPDSGKNKGSEGHQSPQDFQKEAKLIVGGLLLRHLQNLPCNAHEVSEFIHISAVTQNKEKFDLDMIEIGAAAYSFLSLINHSCDPNVVRNSHCGSTAVLRVIKPIKKGEQVFDNYGYHYATHSLEERQLHLSSQYFFTCMCEPCTGNWPLYVSLPSAQLLLKCTHCSTMLEDNFPTNPSEGNLVTCTMCKGVNDVVKRKKVLMESSDRFMENISAVLRGHTEGVATSLVTHLTLLHENVLRPWKEYNDCQEALKQCFNFLGNCYTI